MKNSCNIIWQSASEAAALDVLIVLNMEQYCEQQ